MRINSNKSADIIAKCSVAVKSCIHNTTAIFRLIYYIHTHNINKLNIMFDQMRHLCDKMFDRRVVTLYKEGIYG